jgi:hypothetical protein
MTLTASGGSDGDGARYQWGTGATIGNNVLGTTTVNTYEVSPNAATTYWVRRIGATACTNTTAGTTVTIAAASTPTITLASGSTNQTIPPGSAITAIQYTTTNASGATVTGLPTGVSGSWTSNTYTISGTPPATGTFNYTVTTTNSNGCPNTSASGTIIVSNCYSISWTLCHISRLNSNHCDFPSTPAGASDDCQTRYGIGWRLPTLDEFLCLCNNRTSLGAYLAFFGSTAYWTSTPDPVPGSGGYYFIDFTTCNYSVNSASVRYPIKCVK